MKRYKIFSKKTIIAGSVIFVSFLFILMAFAPALSGAGQTATPATAEKSYIPNPTLNSNITWNTYNSSWAPMQYNNGTGYHNLSAGYSSFYANPISINPGDIRANALNGQAAGKNFFDKDNYLERGEGGSHITIGNATHGVYVTGSANSTISVDATETIGIPWAQMPSQNINFDYITGTIKVPSGSGSATYAGFVIANKSANGAFVSQVISTTKAYSGQSMYISESVAQLIAGSGMQVNSSQVPDIYIGIYLYQPSGPSSDTPVFNISMNNFAITTYPIKLGTNSTGAIISTAAGSAQLTKFAPTVPMVIQNNGYTVAVSQTLKNITESQTSISDGSYVEEATYQGTLSLPTAPDLTYGTSNITLNMAMPGDQYMVATLNGVSYLSAIQAQKNGTFSFGTVNPNSPNSMILEAKYTASQWDASTHAPSFFTLRGIEYYWWVGVIGVLSVVGLGAAAMSHFGGEEETLKVPKGKFGR